PVLSGHSRWVLRGTRKVLIGARRVLSGTRRVLSGTRRVLRGTRRVLRGARRVLRGRIARSKVNNLAFQRVRQPATHQIIEVTDDHSSASTHVHVPPRSRAAAVRPRGPTTLRVPLRTLQLPLRTL